MPTATRAPSSSDKLRPAKIAYATQERLIVNPAVTKRTLLAAYYILTPEQYAGVETERAADGRCGYPLCSKATVDASPRGRFRITRDGLLDTTRARMFCSPECTKASAFFGKQLPTDPLAARNIAALEAAGGAVTYDDMDADGRVKPDALRVLSAPVSRPKASVAAAEPIPTPTLAPARKPDARPLSHAVVERDTSAAPVVAPQETRIAPPLLPSNAHLHYQLNPQTGPPSASSSVSSVAGSETDETEVWDDDTSSEVVEYGDDDDDDDDDGEIVLPEPSSFVQVAMVLMALVTPATAVFVANGNPDAPDVPVESPAQLSRKFEHVQYRELVKGTVLRELSDALPDFCYKADGVPLRALSLVEDVAATFAYFTNIPDLPRPLWSVVALVLLHALRARSPELDAFLASNTVHCAGVLRAAGIDPTSLNSLVLMVTGAS
ncbi:uncharacterized protein AMSG_03086 [Thecamonas trahens ATCC 50062]|uniref:RNA polymerase II subunit B1 CTD phosphatase RPAP2 homolog n=1 Tax=Thecamonas trahens ATCC 50062 TaxID=461836 RepID=A0A0L0D2X5_THETB|nr:hypothetical protein AMSG_03086 [Thecamonas trahens ATCC 50062]KNC46649.1 hypothetical protein AMSG_03086 [Thecamonas trahens ATCC 50062]|eukprot:XP_013760422.1 hypothetical protein AMSG_03086 [Thecamonas trahens ATCC 50062]